MNETALELAIKIIKQFEGLRLNAYHDGAGIPTIGYGHTKGVYMGQTITQEQADEWIKAEVASFMTEVYELLNNEPTNNQLAAFTSFAYNVGIGAFKASTMLRLFNEGPNPTLVAAQFPRWVHDAAGNVEPGLVTRRAEEAALFLS